MSKVVIFDDNLCIGYESFPFWSMLDQKFGIALKEKSATLFLIDDLCLLSAKIHFRTKSTQKKYKRGNDPEEVSFIHRTGFSGMGRTIRNPRFPNWRSFLCEIRLLLLLYVPLECQHPPFVMYVSSVTTMVASRTFPAISYAS